MTMLSFRVETEEAIEVDKWSHRLGVGRSQLLRAALHGYVVRLRAENDIDAWLAVPLDDSEKSFNHIADWGPAEDWSDWSDAAG